MKQWYDLVDVMYTLVVVILHIVEGVPQNITQLLTQAFYGKKKWFSGVFSSFYGQRSVTAAWATRSPWSICPIL